MQKINLHNEIIRKIFHIFTGIIVLLLIYFDIINTYIFLSLIVVSIILYIINKSNKNIPIYSYIVRKVQRNENDIGLITFLIGCTFTYIFFEKLIVLSAISIFTFGDGTSSLIGEIAKKNKNKKSFIGLIFGVLFAYLFSTIFINSKIALFASLITITIEQINTKINDNFFLAPLAGFIINIILKI